MSTQVMHFRAADLDLALRLEALGPMVPVPRLTPVPDAPRFVEGLFAFRGMPVITIRTDLLLGRESDPFGARSVLILVPVDGFPVALHVREVCGLTSGTTRPAEGNGDLLAVFSEEVVLDDITARLIEPHLLFSETDRRSFMEIRRWAGEALPQARIAA